MRSALVSRRRRCALSSLSLCAVLAVALVAPLVLAAALWRADDAVSEVSYEHEALAARVARLRHA